MSSTAFTQCAAKAMEFAEITQYNGHYAVQGHSRSPILVPIESSYTIAYYVLINTNLPPILHRFRDIAADYTDTGKACARKFRKCGDCCAPFRGELGRWVRI